MSLSEVLTPASTLFERSFVDAIDSAMPVPVRTLLNPSITPPDWLPWLAVHEGVSLWFEDWTDARKRQMIQQALELAGLVGTLAAAERFLAFVDAEIIHKVSYPARRPVGRIIVRITPIQFQAFIARYLVKVVLKVHRRSSLVGYRAVGRKAALSFNREPLRRAKVALSASKAPETAYSINFAHRVPISLDDGVDLGGGFPFGEFRDRQRL